MVQVLVSVLSGGNWSIFALWIYTVMSNADPGYIASFSCSSDPYEQPLRATEHPSTPIECVLSTFCLCSSQLELSTDKNTVINSRMILFGYTARFCMLSNKERLFPSMTFKIIPSLLVCSFHLWTFLIFSYDNCHFLLIAVHQSYCFLDATSTWQRDGYTL
jgi:hypothetical protein